MREGYGNRCVCVCVCVCVSVTTLVATYRRKQGVIRLFQDMHCVAFIENALFKSSGDIC